MLSDMPVGDDRSLFEAAEQCDDCLGWLQVCEAECCRGFAFSLTRHADIEWGERVVQIHAPMTPETARYYGLHGAGVDREDEVVTVPRAACTVEGDRLMVEMVCSALDGDLRCRVHGSGQPAICSEFTRETARTGRCVLTPRCLFAFKR